LYFYAIFISHHATSLPGVQFAAVAPQCNRNIYLPLAAILLGAANLKEVSDILVDYIMDRIVEPSIPDPTCAPIFHL